MSNIVDLYRIPGDTGHPWRMNKFVEYQHEVPSIHYRVMGEYIKKFVKNKDDAVMMCWYMSVTYNEITCMLLQETFDWRQKSQSLVDYCETYWSQNKTVLDFGSSRKYAKNMDWFPTLMQQFIKTTNKKPYEWLLQFNGSDPELSYRMLHKTLMNFEFTGRFAADLFMESVLYLEDYFQIHFTEPSKLDWKKCSNLTSGILNIFYQDDKANEYDKTGKLPVSEEYLTECLEIVQAHIKNVYPDQDNSINLFVGKICSFRNLFKNARYGGFHHDRELGVLREYEKRLPQYQYLWDRAFDLRASMFDERFLGEFHDWNGIRKERKKLFLTKGLTGVEKN